MLQTPNEEGQGPRRTRVASRGALALLWLCLVCVSVSLRAEGVALRPAWEKGQTADYEFWVQRDRVTTAVFDDQRRKQTLAVVSEGRLTWEVVEALPDGGFRALMTLAWMSVSTTADGGATEVNDSRKPSGAVPLMHDLLEAMVGVPVEVEVAADGSVRSIDGLEPMRQRAEVAEAVPDETDFEETASGLASLPFAPATLEPGGGWSASHVWNHELGEVAYDWDYRLESVENIAGVPVAVVRGRGNGELRPDADAPSEVTLNFEVELAEQTAMFDLLRGEAVGRDDRLVTEVEMVVRLPDGRRLTRVMREDERSQVVRVSEGGAGDAGG